MKKLLIAIILTLATIQPKIFGVAEEELQIPTPAYLSAELAHKQIFKTPELVKAWARNRGTMILLEAKELNDMGSEMGSAEYKDLARELMDAAKKLISITPPFKNVIAGVGENQLDVLTAAVHQAHLWGLAFLNWAKQTSNLTMRNNLVKMARSQLDTGRKLQKDLQNAQKLKPEGTTSHCTKEKI